MNVNSLMSSFWTQFQQTLQTPGSAPNGTLGPNGTAPSDGHAHPSAAAAGSGATSHVSSMGQMLAQLQQLSKANPAGFKTIMTSMSQALSKEAEKGGAGSQALLAIANNFAKAAETGSLSALTGGDRGSPPPGGQHRHSHGGGAGGTPTQSVMDEMLAAFQSAVSAVMGGPSSGGPSATGGTQATGGTMTGTPAIPAAALVASTLAPSSTAAAASAPTSGLQTGHSIGTSLTA